MSLPNFHNMKLWFFMTLLFFICAFSRDMNHKKGNLWSVLGFWYITLQSRVQSVPLKMMELCIIMEQIFTYYKFSIYVLLFYCICSTGFSLFNVVKFKHDQCISTSTYPSGFSRDGTCLTESKCEERNGTAFGSCASG